MVNTNNWIAMSDRAIIASVGNFIKERRLRQNKTQVLIAEKAGVNPWTISQIENGEPITLLSLIQILRALDALNVFDAFSITPEISPLALAKLEKEKRKRARGKRDSGKDQSDW